MIRRSIVTAALAAAVSAGASIAAAPPAAAYRVCIRAPCFTQYHRQLVVVTTARYVFGRQGLLAAGWSCRHVSGRTWVCTRYGRRHL